MPINSLEKTLKQKYYKTPKKKAWWTRKDAEQGYRSSYPKIKGWERKREATLKLDNYICRECRKNGYTTPAKVVDHIVPQAQGGGHNQENLQSLCNKCHDIKTIEDNKAEQPKIKSVWDI